MSCVLELNDIELRLARAGEVLAAGPGYAVVAEDRVELGEAALSQARLDPRRTYNRYWNRLNQEPLKTPARHVRHHADLAYAQLLALHEQAGAPPELLFAVPGSYTREQLALLLGIAAACPFRTAALVDRAVAGAAAVAGPGRYVHVDIELHQVVITTVEVGADCARKVVEVVDASGLAAMLDQCAKLAADAFVQQCRFDPYHQARTEQALYDNLPRWLAQLDGAAEVVAGLDFPGRHEARLSRVAVLERLQPFYERIRARVPAGVTCLVGHRLAALPGVLEQLPDAFALDAGAVFRGCAALAPPEQPDGAAVEFVTRLPPAREPRITARGDARAEVISHVLCGHRAWALGPAPLFLSAAGGVSATPPAGAGCGIVRNGPDVLARPLAGTALRVNEQPVERETPVAAGDAVSFEGGGPVYLFITATPADGAP